MSAPTVLDQAIESYRQSRIAHWDSRANQGPGYSWTSGFYRQQITQLYRSQVPAGSRVLDLGCGKGDLLAAVAPSHGVGVDFSPEHIRQARVRHPELEFHVQDAHELDIDGDFDVIILSGLINELWDVQMVFRRAAAIAGPSTRILIDFYSRLWEQPLSLARRLRVARVEQGTNWLNLEDVENLLHLEGIEIVRHRLHTLWPMRTPIVDSICNRFLVRLWPLSVFALTHFVVARTDPEPAATASVSIVVPARNEEGNVTSIFERVPEVGASTELVFVEGHSSDDTLGAIERAIREHPNRRARLFRQEGEGKGDAVRLGFQEATGDILMILDADLTVPPEDLPRFYEALVARRGELINGVRLVYPLEDKAMRFLNVLGNRFFSLLFTWLLEQPIKDTLCGTKVLWRRDYERIAANRAVFGRLDPFGDFDLIFGAAKLNLKIVDLPVRYRMRRFGDTNIQRWKHGLLLLRMALLAARKIKFS